MHKVTLYLLGCLLVLLGFESCDKGLAPPSTEPIVIDTTKPGIYGVVHFSKPWPIKDSALLTLLVLSPIRPPYKVESVPIYYLTNQFKTLTIDYGVDSFKFAYQIDTGTYYYLGVVQQYGPDIQKSLHVVGFAHDSLDTPLQFDLRSIRSFPGVQINVRYDSLPVQPFE
jgi:hypothetical protein